ncbi:FkbM family methyltransferase [Rhodovulum sp. YNF3179]|uniref:FkbM family methyltransferase n=1 Tax=Rhodovulum sp. YNF3179 TaxID=3425127 RepID=UPI003D353C76
MIGTRVVELDGIKLNSRADTLPEFVRNMLFKGTYEQGERELVREVVRPHSRVLEIGTGIGFISLLCTRLAGEGQVLSYEANPVLKDIIHGNYALNGLEPRLEMKAVTVDGTPIRFFKNENIISSSLIDRDLEASEIEVESDAINDVIMRHEPDIIVMDVEGAETDLLPAADLAKVRAILVELHPHIVGAPKIAELIEYLVSEGYEKAGERFKNVLMVRTGYQKHDTALPDAVNKVSG